MSHRNLQAGPGDSQRPCQRCYFTYLLLFSRSTNATSPVFILGFLLTEESKLQNRSRRLPLPHPVTFWHPPPRTWSSCCSRSRTSRDPASGRPPICGPDSATAHTPWAVLQLSPTLDIITSFFLFLASLPFSATTTFLHSVGEKLLTGSV